MKYEINVQTEIINDIDEKVDTQIRVINSHNLRLKNIVNQVGKDKLCIYFILIVTFIGIIAWIFNNV